MVSCSNCAAPNSLDSAFCRKCGAGVSADDVKIAQERLDRAVADGFKIFNAGRLDEATHIAESAVRDNPSFIAGLQLMAMCHERRGEISEALACHERILVLDPDSVIDRLKVNDLRNLLVTSVSAASVPNRRLAIMGAMAAFVFVTSIGVLLATSGSGEPAKVATITQPQGAIDSAQRFDPSILNQAPPGAQANPVRQAPAVTNNDAGAAAQVQQGNDAAQQSPARGMLPSADNQAPFGMGNIGPLRINPEIVPKPNPPVVKATVARSPDPDPATDNNSQPQPQREAPGIMEIKILSRNGQATTGSGDAGSGANGVEALMRTARHQYQIGNYTAAAQSYERALRGGADAASANQRLAQCYEKLGRNSDGAAAYQRAIAALESELSSGKGDKDRIAAALDSCKQAVKVLGG